jgi:hypothetical protein
LQLVIDGVVTETSQQVGVSCSRHAGAAHDVINPNPYEFRFVEIELK